MSHARERIFAGEMKFANEAEVYFREMMKLCGPGVGRNSFDAKPAFRNIRSYSDIGYESPARVEASMIRLKPAAVAGVTRSSFGTNSTVTARPLGPSAA
jgi:hypothetical protein